MKVGLSCFITIIVAPTLGPMPQFTVFSAMGVWIIVNQFVIGAALGLTMQIVFTAIQATGEFVGLGMGLGFATFFDQQSSGSTAVRPTGRPPISADFTYSSWTSIPARRRPLRRRSRGRRCSKTDQAAL